MLEPQDLSFTNGEVMLSESGKKRTYFYDFVGLGHKTLILINKADLSSECMNQRDVTIEAIPCRFVSVKKSVCYECSQSHNLRTQIELMLGSKDVSQGIIDECGETQSMFTNHRQIGEMQQIVMGLDQFLGKQSGQTHQKQHLPLDIRAEGLRVASQALSRLAGYTSTEDVLQEIFSNFCIGK